MRRHTVAMLSAVLLLALGGAARADGDPAKGAKVFAKCKTCHEIDSDKNKVGPTLQGVIGRPAGAVPGFKYSEAMSASGVVWDAETIAAYTRQPKEFIPGNKMVFAGLKKDDEIEDLIAFIESKCCS